MSGDTFEEIAKELNKKNLSNFLNVKKIELVDAYEGNVILDIIDMIETIYDNEKRKKDSHFSSLLYFDFQAGMPDIRYQVQFGRNKEENISFDLRFGIRSGRSGNDELVCWCQMDNNYGHGEKKPGSVIIQYIPEGLSPERATRMILETFISNDFLLNSDLKSFIDGKRRYDDKEIEVSGSLSSYGVHGHEEKFFLRAKNYIEKIDSQRLFKR